MKNKTVIVGGAGFLGTALAQGLRRMGIDVLVIDLESRLAAAAKGLQEVKTAIFGFPDPTGIEQFLEGTDTLIHLSCTSTPASSMRNMSRDAAENIAPSVAIFEAAGRAGVSRVIFASSGGTVYGSPATLPVSEEETGWPLSGYGVSKLAIEHYLSLVAARDGFTGISLRIGNPYGAFQLRGAAIGLIANHLIRVHSGQAPEVWGDGTVIRDYIHIDDVTNAFLATFQTPDMTTGSYNIGSGNGMSINEIWSIIRSVTVTDLDLKYQPSRGFDVEAIVLDTTRFRTATGWAPQVSLCDGIAGLWNALNA